MSSQVPPRSVLIKPRQCPQDMINMKLIIFFIFCGVKATASTDRDEDHHSKLTELELEQFLEVFDLPRLEEPVEKKKRAEILKENQQKVLEANQAFLAGNQSWREEINEFSHLTEEEFLASHTGLGLAPHNDSLASMASLASLHTEEEVEELGHQGSRLPDAYSSVSEHLIGPVKHQRCGTCQLFATLALVEICHAKTFHHRAAYSEQQVLDCAYNGRDLKGCAGAPYEGYALWLQRSRLPLVSQRTYPTLRRAGFSGHCHKRLRPLRPRVSVTKAFHSSSRDGDGRRSLLASERKMKRLVFERGAVGTTLATTNFGRYKHGVFAGCPEREYYSRDHMVTVVGYGRESGVDYWLVRNSW